jgi:DNA polymerase I-like protein with 3'-5' exonuclease and polymerase domains
MVRTVLIDRRNFETELPIAVAAIAACTTLIGLDCETQDDGRHEGLNQFMRVNEETRKKAVNRKLVFDMRRTVMTGFSIHVEGSDVSWYVNLAHADVENRLSWAQVKCLLDAKQPNTLWVAHNATYEITCFAKCHGYQLSNIVCTMQLSVTAFGDDNYDIIRFRGAPLGDLERHVKPLLIACLEQRPADLEPDEEGERPRRFSRKIDEIIGKICAKESVASTNYNGYVDELAYGHGLKDLVKAFFGYQMATFAETMGDDAHMGQLTGDQVVDYGADDAYWVIPLFHKLMEHVAINSPDALETFFTQENPMIYVFSEIWQGGMKVNFSAIEERRVVERAEFARILREMKAEVRSLLPFAAEPNTELAKRQDWYEKNHARYRNIITSWANSPDSDDDYEQCFQVSSPVSNAWAEERGEIRKKSVFSITHYMPARVMLYDLLGAKLMFDMGKLTSDGEARGKIQDLLTGTPAKIVGLMTAMASVETRMKLYLTPYVLLTDPETQRMYPVVNCLLNTRRLAASSPNPMQLAKRGDSTYVRGFFEPDHDDHVIVSLDWSAFELVIIGELSKDPTFGAAFAQLPHQDMHAGAAADILRVELPWLNEEIFTNLRKFETAEDFCAHWNIKLEDCSRLFTNLKGETMTPPKARGYWRTEIGKGANFNYWYSGFLTTVGDRMGWSIQRTGEATDYYRSRFSVAEDWRLDTILHGQTHGFVQLPDGHRRFRYEAMSEWMDVFKAKWPDVEELRPVIHEIARRISKRAQNQLVNAMVQGTNAFVIKRSILSTKARLKEMGWGDREARFMIPIHDEKVWSVHKDRVAEFITVARHEMMNHPDIFPTLKLDATPAVGLTFEPWNAKKAKFGQIELFEAPDLDFLPKDKWGGRLNDNETAEVVDFLMHQRRAA